MYVYIGLGSNLEDRQVNLKKAMKLLSENLHIDSVSSIYETEPVGYSEQPMFLNAVCRARTNLGPMQLLSLLKGIEVNLGRVANFPNGPRTIDLDIIFYDDIVMDTPELTIPHPRVKERAFVLIPLLEIDPDRCHPISGERIKDLMADVKEQYGVNKIGELGVEYV